MEDEWYYMDSTGKEFGPYPSSTMSGWFSQGFFPMKGDLQVRLSTWHEHHLIKDLYPDPIEKRAFLGPPNVPLDSASGGRQRSSAAARNAAPVAMPDMPAYDFGASSAAMLGFPGMAGMGGMGGMPGGPFPGMMPAMGGMMPGMMPGGMGMPRMPGVGMGGSNRFTGRIKSFNQQKGFGFIECQDSHAVYGRDVFLHKAQIQQFDIGATVTFSVNMNKENMPQAKDLVAAEYFGMPMNFSGGMGMPGKGGYNAGKGGGKGKGGRGKNNNQGGNKKPPNPKAAPKKNGGGPAGSDLLPGPGPGPAEDES